MLTIIGGDRPGLVESVSRVVAAHDGNWLESRMSRLAGKFAGILRVDVPEARADALTDALRALAAEGLTVVVEKASDEPSPRYVALRLELVGQDRPGIVREISAALAAQGINVDALDTACQSAPMSGEALFTATARLRVPLDVGIEALRAGLEELAHDLMVDLTLDEADAAD